MTTGTAGAETTEAAWHLWNNKLFTKLGAIKVAQFGNPCQEGKQFRKTKAQPRVEQNVSETRKLESGPQPRAFIIPPRTVQVFTSSQDHNKNPRLKSRGERWT
jgi:hypothetical protein